MKIHQLSVFVENKPGRLSEPCAALGRAGINVLSLALADTHQFGTLRLVVPEGDLPRARDVLTEAGCVVTVTEVVAVGVPDEPGGLAHVLELIERAGVNVEYVYPMARRPDGRSILVFRFDAPGRAIQALTAGGVDVLDGGELSGRVVQ